MGTRILKALNKCFPMPMHPLNMQNEGIMTLSRWQYEKGENTIRYYLARVTKAEMFEGKTVLDVGCGAGGKTMYYISLGAKKMVGMDIAAQYKPEAEAFARELGFSDRFEFVSGDAAAMGFADDSFDSVIMNDAMEHVAEPEAVLAEVYRVLKPGGRLYVNFPPYDHPYGAHLSDAIGIPWVHRLFREKTLIAAYKELVSQKPDAEDRLAFRFSRNARGEEYISYINKMSISRFNGLLKKTPLRVYYYHEEPLRGFLSPLAKVPGVKEFFVKMVVCILEK